MAGCFCTGACHKTGRCPNTTSCRPFTTDDITQQSIEKENFGWKCPSCGKVHAPFVPNCNCHIIIKEITS